MRWFAFQRSPGGRVPVAFDEHPKLTPTMAVDVIWETLREIPEAMRGASLAELAKRLSALVLAGWMLMPVPARSEGALDDAATQAWIACIWEASDALAMQPEPVSVIVSAVYGICSNEEIAMAEGSVGWVKTGKEMVDGYKRDYQTNKIMGRVLAYRAMHGVGDAPSRASQRGGSLYLEQ